MKNTSHRPLARDPELFERLYYERRQFYEKAEVHVHVPGDDSRSAVDQLLALELLD